MHLVRPQRVNFFHGSGFYCFQLFGVLLLELLDILLVARAQRVQVILHVFSHLVAHVGCEAICCAFTRDEIWVCSFL
jgi:hypothetical protein